MFCFFVLYFLFVFFVCLFFFHNSSTERTRALSSLEKFRLSDLLPCILFKSSLYQYLGNNEVIRRYTRSWYTGTSFLKNCLQAPPPRFLPSSLAHYLGAWFRLIRTLRWGDYGLRTTAGSHFQDWDETRVFSHPTVASSRRCVVEGFYVVWKGGLRIHHIGMKKQFNARKLRNSCCLVLELQTNARLEQLQELMNSVQRKMHR